MSCSPYTEHLHKPTYLDNAATTSLYPEVLDAMLPYLTSQYGNPSSLHSLGRTAHIAIEKSRSIIASLINAIPSEIIFTSGATESNNWIYCANSDKKCLCTAIEHASVYNQPDTNIFNVTEEGSLNINLLEYTLRDNDYKLFTSMLVNNEIGTILPIDEIGEVCYRNNVLFHVDATQGLCYVPIDVKKNHISYLSASAHKIHGPKGVGFLYVSEGLQSSMCSLFYGGSQEQEMRAGTENVAGIVGFAKAVEILSERREAELKKLKKLRDYMHYQIMNNIDDIELNGTADFDRRITSNLNYRFKDVKAEELVEMLDEYGICCSAGSACHSHSSMPSHVLKAIGLSDKEAKSSVRFSLGSELEKDDIDFVVQVLVKCVESLREYS